jgi:hypothetical protein
MRKPSSWMHHAAILANSKTTTSVSHASGKSGRLNRTRGFARIETTDTRGSNVGVPIPSRGELGGVNRHSIRVNPLPFSVGIRGEAVDLGGGGAGASVPPVLDRCWTLAARVARAVDALPQLTGVTFPAHIRGSRSNQSKTRVLLGNFQLAEAGRYTTVMFGCARRTGRNLALCPSVLFLACAGAVEL